MERPIIRSAIFHLVLLSQLWGCANVSDISRSLSPSAISPDDVAITRTLGLHSWPCKVNERFVIEEVRASSNRGLMPPENVLPIAIAYYLDGKRRTPTFKKAGDTDGFITYLGYFFGRSEEHGRQGGLSEEHIVRLKTGEEITVVGNTLAYPGTVKLEKL